MWHNWPVCPSWTGVVTLAHVLFDYVCGLPLAPASKAGPETATWHNSVPCGKLNGAQDSAASSVLASLSAWKGHTPPVGTLSDLEGIKKQVLCVLKLYVETDPKKLSVSSHFMKNQVAVSWKMN